MGVQFGNGLADRLVRPHRNKSRVVVVGFDRVSMNQVVDTGMAGETLGKALVAHPGIVINFAQITAATIGQQYHHQFIFVQVLGNFQCPIQGCTAGATD